MKSRVVLWVAGYLAGALLLTTASQVLDRRVAAPTGLVRSFYSAVGFAGAPLFEERTTAINLEFLAKRPELPRRFLSVRWRGFWFLPENEAVDLYVGGDDRVDVLVDGRLVLRRDAREGMETTRRTVALGAGPHALSVEYQQYAGAFSLNMLAASAGGRPEDFSPTQLFAVRPDASDYRLATVLFWLRRFVRDVWLAPVVFVLLALIRRFGATWLQAGRRTARYWHEVTAPQTVGDFTRRFSSVAWPALLGPVVLFLLGPYTIYAGNRGEFSVPFTAIAVPWLVRWVGVSWGLLLAVGCGVCLLSDRLTRTYSALLLGAGLLIWAQGNLWVGQYGPLNGAELNLDRFPSRPPYELAAWVAVPVLAIAFWRSVSRSAPFVALTFLTLQAAMIAIVSASPGSPPRARWVDPPAALYQFSSGQNVIHIVLDEFQSDLFSEMRDANPAWFDKHFGGFEYFADHLGAFPTTSVSIPVMLAGREYRNEQPFKTFVRQAFAESSIFNGLIRAGYEVDATSIVPAPWFEDWLGPEGSTSRTNGARFTIPKPFVSQVDYREFTGRELIQLSVFRHAPRVAKAAFLSNRDQFDRAFSIENGSGTSERRHDASNSAAFFRQFIATMSVGRERPVYKLLHLGIPHRPVVLGEDCAFIGPTNFSRDAYVAQSWCAIKLVASFLERLRKLGIYDSSLIVVSSDHGTGLEPMGFSGKSQSLPLIQGASTASLSAIVGSSKALMIIKPPGRSGPLGISQAPTAHVDLPATMLDLLGLPHGVGEQSMFRMNPEEPRRRVYGMYDVRQRFPDEYLDRLDVLTVEHRVVDATGWSLERAILPPGAKLTDRTVDFGAAEATQYLGPGWSEAERETVNDSRNISFVRAIAGQAVVFASLPPGSTKLIARLSSPGNGVDTIDVSLDGRFLQRWVPSGREGYEDYSVDIPPDAARPPISSVVFRFAAQPGANLDVKFDRIVIDAD